MNNLAAVVEQMYQDPTLRKSIRLHGKMASVGVSVSPISALVLDLKQNLEKEKNPPCSIAGDQLSHTHSYSHTSKGQFIKASFNYPQTGQFGIYNTIISKKLSPQAIIALLFEYKGAKQLKLDYIKQGLGEMDLDKVVKYGPNDSPQKKCSQRIAVIITRTFSYMIQAELEYGCIWSGEAIFFLRALDDPSTVLYHLSVPSEDVGTSTGWSDEKKTENRLQLTAVAVTLAFALQSARTLPQSNSWRLKAMRRLKTWKVAYEDLLNTTPELDGLNELNKSNESNIDFSENPLAEKIFKV
ncbi:hypothetical protein K3495_g2448 [Podosphaera aphanis]|nr:hypothetical protein K3495_g2448 [Podosphaera aphanis]